MDRKILAYLQQLPAEVCVYCKKRATTRDHVVARTILARPLPANPPTVPSCIACNNRFSKDEQYFVSVLGMIGHTPQIEERIQEGADIYRTLERSPKLDDRLIASVLYAPELGAPPVLQIEEMRLSLLFQKMAFGLFLANYRPAAIPRIETFIPVSLREVTSVEKMNVTQNFRQRRRKILQRDVFDYVFFKSTLAPYIGVRFCLMRFYGPTFVAAVRCPARTQRSAN